MKDQQDGSAGKSTHCAGDPTWIPGTQMGRTSDFHRYTKNTCTQILPVTHLNTIINFKYF